MAFMLIAVTLFFALVGLFITSVLFSGLSNSRALLEEKNAMLLASRLANSPEFSCGNAFGTSRTNCVDFDKVMALKEQIKKYSDTGFWGVTGIEIVKIHPNEYPGVLCSLENYPNCEKIELVKTNSGTGISNFISLCRKEALEGEIEDKCEIAKIVLNYNG